MALLHERKGKVPLEEALATAEAALASYDVAALLHPNGPAFDAIFFRNLFLLDRTVHDPRIAALAAAYGEETWKRRPDRRPTRGAVVPWALNARAPLVEVYALLAGATPHP